MASRVFTLLLLFILSVLSSCIRLEKPFSTLVPTTPPPAATGQADTWQTLAPGLEARTYTPNNNRLSLFRAIRIDPDRYIFRVHYQPGQPLSLDGWRRALPDAIAFINANFFTPEFTINGLLVSDGAISGQSYRDRGGMFQVQDGLPRVRSLILEPYIGEPLQQAVQAFPMLVANGVQAYTSTRADRVTRRTVIAQDDQDRIILIATPLAGMTLRDLSAFLANSDMRLVNALNLDGGGSTLLYESTQGLTITSFDPVPAVLAVYPG